MPRACASYATAASCCPSTTSASAATSPRPVAKLSSRSNPTQPRLATDFFELETSGGGTWRSGEVIDYATKLVLAGPVTATQTTRDAITAIEDARAQVHDLLGRALLDDVTNWRPAGRPA